MLFALRAVLSTAILGPSIAWLATRPAFSWELWRLLFVGATGAISTLVLGPRNARWLSRWDLSGPYGLLLAVILPVPMSVAGVAFVAALGSGERLLWLICGGGLATVAACT